MEMDKDRIATIIKEICYWKEHNLLPNEYCDFLLALYTNGEGVHNDQKEILNEHLSLVMLFKLLFLLLLIPFSFIIIYLMQIDSFWQLGILLLILSLSYWGYISFKKVGKSYLNLTFIIFLLLFLVVTIYLSKLFFVEQWITTFIVSLNLIGWLLESKRKQSKYLLAASLFGLLLMTFYIVF